MKIVVSENFETSCQLAARRIIETITHKPDALIGLATGETPLPVYKELVQAHKQGLSFKEVRTINLDEYAGLSDPLQSYRYYMDSNLFNHVDIKRENINIADYEKDAEQEAARIRLFLRENRIDIQLLGVGRNGHIGFNEPDEQLYAYAHVTDLKEDTIDANARFFKSSEEVPTKAITMGMSEIGLAREVILLATGDNKVDAIRGLIQDDYITPNNPCTFLKMCAHATIFIDKALYDACMK